MGTFIGVLIVIGFVLFIAKAGGGLKKKKKLNKYIEKLENRLEESRKRTSNIKGPNIEDYPGSPQYQALLKKYNGNIPGAGQGDQSKGKTKGRNLGSQYGKKVAGITRELVRMEIDIDNIFNETLTTCTSFI